jgi:hypothetical protein
MYEDEIVSVNSEIRYISLELMKIASREKRSFKEIAEEYVENVYFMHSMIKDSPEDFATVRSKATRR